MNNKTAETLPVKDEKKSAFETEMDELKREMRSAKWMDWVQSNRKLFMAAAAGVLVLLLATGLWIENDKSQRGSAATLYQQALAAGDAGEKQTLMISVTKDFSSSSYAALALTQLAMLDIENRETHLNALIAHSESMQEWVWQAKLDLAELKLEQGDKAAALQQLQSQFGKQYQQLRYYLMASATDDATEKAQYLQQALDAESIDNMLKQKIETLLAK